MRAWALSVEDPDGENVEPVELDADMDGFETVESAGHRPGKPMIVSLCGGPCPDRLKLGRQYDLSDMFA